MNIPLRTTVSQNQHLGRSDGGGGNFWFGWGPSKTIHAILSPQLVWTSRWQCINHTPVNIANIKFVNFDPFFKSKGWRRENYFSKLFCETI